MRAIATRNKRTTITLRRIFVGLLAAVLLIPVATAEVSKRRLGENVNTSYAEVLPIASADGQTLYFTRANYPDPALRAVIEKNYDDHLKNCNDLGPLMRELAKKEGRTLSPEHEAMLKNIGGDCKKAEEAKQKELHNFKFQQHPNQTWIAQRADDGSWKKAVRAPAPINDEALTNIGNMSIVSAAPDRSTLLIQGDMMFGRQRTDGCSDFAALIGVGKRRCLPLAFARRNAKGNWTRSDRIRTQPFDPPLSVHGAALSPTADAIVLAAKKPGTHVDNKAQLYVTRWLEDEALWAAPVQLASLGGDWNSLAPFIAPDGKSLYFASDRPGGRGGFDIWLSRRQGPDWASWSEAKNLGKSINSAEDESSLSVDASGGYAFMSQGKGAQQDIYEFGLPPNLSPAPTAIVGGRIYQLGGPGNNAEFEWIMTGEGGALPPPMVLNGAGGALEGFDATEEAVTFVSISNGGVAGSAGINPASGSFSTSLPVGDSYAVYVNVKGFAGIGQVVDLTNVQQGAQLEQNLSLTKLEEGATIRLNNVYFDTNEWVLLKESRIELNRLVNILSSYPTMKIEIGGHTDSIDDDEHNLLLSNNRARAVYEFLIEAGVDQTRLSSKGYGERRPVASNSDEKGRKLNRRVEFKILQM